MKSRVVNVLIFMFFLATVCPGIAKASFFDDLKKQVAQSAKEVDKSIVQGVNNAFETNKNDKNKLTDTAKQETTPEVLNQNNTSNNISSSVSNTATDGISVCQDLVVMAGSLKSKGFTSPNDLERSAKTGKAISDARREFGDGYINLSANDKHNSGRLVRHIAYNYSSTSGVKTEFDSERANIERHIDTKMRCDAPRQSGANCKFNNKGNTLNGFMRSKYGRAGEKSLMTVSLTAACDKANNNSDLVIGKAIENKVLVEKFADPVASTQQNAINVAYETKPTVSSSNNMAPAVAGVTPMAKLSMDGINICDNIGKIAQSLKSKGYDDRFALNKIFQRHEDLSSIKSISVIRKNTNDGYILVQNISETSRNKKPNYQGKVARKFSYLYGVKGTMKAKSRFNDERKRFEQALGARLSCKPQNTDTRDSCEFKNESIEYSLRSHYMDSKISKVLVQIHGLCEQTNATGSGL